MTGKMELEKLPRFRAARESEMDVGRFLMGLSDRQIEEMLNDSLWRGLTSEWV